MSAFPESGHSDHLNLTEIKGRFRLSSGHSSAFLESLNRFADRREKVVMTYRLDWRNRH
jgi:hypothetical protein